MKWLLWLKWFNVRRISIVLAAVTFVASTIGLFGSGAIHRALSGLVWAFVWCLSLAWLVISFIA
jgi:hypothetical protein